MCFFFLLETSAISSAFSYFELLPFPGFPLYAIYIRYESFVNRLAWACEAQKPVGRHSIDVKIVTNMTVAAIFPGLKRVSKREKRSISFFSIFKTNVEKESCRVQAHFSREPRDAQVRRGKAKTENKVGKEEDFEKNYSI